jgi:putative transposase
MVRAGVVDHPRQWREAGYQEIQNPPKRYHIIDREALCELLAVDDARLAEVQNEWIEANRNRGNLQREPQWSEAIAVGRRSFVEQVKEQLGLRARYRRVEQWYGASLLRETAAGYRGHSDKEIEALSQNPGPDPHRS